QAQMDSILAALGEPETVANRYLMERGMKPTKPPMSPVVKWVVIGFLGTTAMLFAFLGVALFKFSPLFTIDGEKEQISILGGMIQINGEEGTVRIGESVISDGESWGSVPFSGKWELRKDKTRFLLKFQNGKVELKT